MPKGIPKGRRVAWTQEKVEWLKEHAGRQTHAETQAEFNTTFGEQASLSAVKWKIASLGIKSQNPNAGQFKKGQPSYNKGMKQEDFMSEEGMKKLRAHWFKKGNIPHNAKQIGYERVEKDGYRRVKVQDGSGNGNYKPVSHIVWSETHGREVPEDCSIVFADGDRSNTEPDNLIAVQRSIVLRINQLGLKWHDLETLEACIAIAKLEKAVYAAKKTKRPCAACGTVFDPEYPRQARCRNCIDAGIKAERKKRK